MNGTHDPFTPPQWLIRTCRFLWKVLRGWWSVGIEIFWNIVAALFFLPISPLAGLTPLWLFKYRSWIAVVLLSSLCLTLLIAYLSKFDITPSLRERKQLYLERMKNEHKEIKLSGIPNFLFLPATQLDDIFIAQEFVREWTPAGIDYPPRQDELSFWQRTFVQRKRRLPRELADWDFQREKVEIADVWQDLTKEHPLAIVQGYPGMGKSTLMKRLTLHMARRCLGEADSLQLPGDPALVPLFIDLKKYADAFKKAQASQEKLPLSRYIPELLQESDWYGKEPWESIHAALEQGKCLVLFDGLDETGDAESRRLIAQEIRTFIVEQGSAAAEQKTFNRFLVTSRVAGYKTEYFPGVLPYRIVELTASRMHELLNLWYAVVLKKEGKQMLEAKEHFDTLHSSIDKEGAIFRLAENPLLLMLMAAMAREKIPIPEGRAELYDIITLTLLEHRERDKKLDPIKEDEAIRRLGPLAYKMQTTESIASEQTVKESLFATIKEERTRNIPTWKWQLIDPIKEQAEIEQELQKFLTLIRERSNLFVQRTGEDFSFFHKSFQEYFTARYLLNAIQHDRETQIARFVALARQIDDVWREPFLFAIGYQTAGRGKDMTVAQKLLQGLLQASMQEGDSKQRLHDLLLVIDAMLESREKLLDEQQEQQLIERLLQRYFEAQYEDRFDDCKKIEQAFKRWLLN